MHRGYAKLVVASRYAVDSSTKRTFNELVQEYNQVGAEQLAEADALYESREYAEAIDLYQTLGVMRKLRVGAMANRRIAEAKRDPAMRHAMREREAAALYQQALEVIWAAEETPRDRESAEEHCCDECEAAAIAESKVSRELRSPWDRDDERPRDLSNLARRAVELCVEDQVKLVDGLTKVADRYDDTPAGRDAAQLHARLIENPVIRDAVVRAGESGEADKAYEQAMRYLDDDVTYKAVELFEEILEKWPDSDAATKARAQLRVLEALGEID